MNKNIVPGIVIAVLLASGYFLYQGMNKTPAPTSTSQETNNQPATDASNQNNGVDLNVQIGISKTYDVIYTDSGYAPSELAIKAGDTVTFKNQSSHNMWTASAMHPSHTMYSGTSLQQHCPDTANTSFDECKNDQPGTSWSFTFTKKGTWGYHNHVAANRFGKIIVE